MPQLVNSFSGNDPLEQRSEGHAVIIYISISAKAIASLAASLHSELKVRKLECANRHLSGRPFGYLRATGKKSEVNDK